MKHIALAILLFISVPVFVQAEVIRSFDSTIELSADGSFVVTEEILYDFEESERHGIYRTIPVEHPQEATVWYKSRQVNIELLEVLVDGGAVSYVVTDDDPFSLRIGDPNTTITGPHTYTIVYRIQGGLFYYDTEAPEFYWNVTGDEWEVSIQQATATIQDSEGVFDESYPNTCYEGTRGSGDVCEVVSNTDGSVTFVAGPLASGEGLTIAQALDGSRVAKVVYERLPVAWLVGLGTVLWLIGTIVFLYRQVTIHRTGNTIIAQYEPYGGLLPMYTGVVVDGRLDAKDITAGIIYLAEQGFFRIKKIEKKVFFAFSVSDYVITLRRPYSDIETPFEREVFSLLFDTGAEVGDEIALSDLKGSVSTQRKNQKVLRQMQKGIQKELVASGFFEHSFARSLRAALGVVIFPVVFLLLFIQQIGFTAVSVLLCILGVFLLIALAVVYRRRTRKGYEAQEHLKGFKEFLAMTDTERFAFHNAPEKSPEQFMEYLPYAIAFGVEEEWAEVFSDITIPNPEWYDDGSTGAFSAVTVAESVGAFSTAFASSSGASASSGGGSAGGGAGGGGGGSW